MLTKLRRNPPQTPEQAEQAELYKFYLARLRRHENVNGACLWCYVDQCSPWHEAKTQISRRHMRPMTPSAYT